jgi:hypothetical protein
MIGEIRGYMVTELIPNHRGEVKGFRATTWSGAGRRVTGPGWERGYIACNQLHVPTERIMGAASTTTGSIVTQKMSHDNSQ